MGSQLRFSDPGYINWIRDTLALLYLKDGIQKVVSTEADNFHKGLQKAIGVHGTASPSCTSCTPRDIPNSFRGRWRMNCLLCNPWLVQIVKNHRDQACPNIHRDNTDPKRWPAKPWEVLKCYMGFGCQSIQSAKNADAQNILIMLKTCQHFGRCGRLGKFDLVDALLNITNSLFHSGNYLVADTKLDDDIQTMLDFLAGLTALSSDESQAVKTATDKINKIRTNRVDLFSCPDREIRVLKAKHYALETKLRHEINKASSNVKALQSEVADNMKRIATVKTANQKPQTGLSVVAKEQKADKIKIAKHEDASKFQQTDHGAVKDDQNTTEERVIATGGNVGSVKKLVACFETCVLKHPPDQHARVVTVSTDLTLRVQTIAQMTSVTPNNPALRGKKQKTTTDILPNVQKKSNKQPPPGQHARVATVSSDLTVRELTTVQMTSDRPHSPALRDKKQKTTIKILPKDNLCVTGQFCDDSGYAGVPSTFVQEVLRKCTTCIIQDLEPDPVLDVFEEENTFGNNTKIQVRDLREAKDTSDKNRKIREAFNRNPNIYVSLKRALVRTRQTGLLRRIEVIEKDVLAGQIEKIHGGKCAHGDKCSYLERLKDTTKLPPVESSKVTDLRTSLVELYKERLQCIPIYLIKPDWKHPVEDLFVKQKLKRVDPRGKPEHPDNPDIFPTGDDDNNLDKVTDIFFEDDKLHVCKDVFVTSEAGYGKTTLCVHLVRLWCDAHSKIGTDLAKANPELAKDLNSMKRFRLLFYINLREADIPDSSPNSDEISLLVHTQLELSDRSYSLADINECLHDSSTLVLMDSLDELRVSRLPYRGLHNKSCIVTTSRPWKLEALRTQLESKIGYQQIELVGLAETSPTDLVQNVLRILNKEYKQKKQGDDFLRAMEGADLQDFLAIPVLILQMLILWYDGESFGRSQSEIYSNIVHHQILATIKNKELPKYEGRIGHEFPLSCSFVQCTCGTYEELLWKVARLAFQTLFGGNREMCLVFDHEITSFYELSDEEVEICLKLGILTQQKLFVNKVSATKKSVSFLHKTNQEFFASVHLSYRWQTTEINSVIKDLDRAMELDKVLLFCSELNSNVASKLTRRIHAIADDSQRVLQYRMSGDDKRFAPNVELIFKIQNIVSAADQQLSSQQSAETTTPLTQSRSRSTPKVILADTILGKTQLSRTGRSRCLVEALDMAMVKSVHIDATYANAIAWKLLELTRKLQTLVVDNFQGTNEVENIPRLVMNNQANLRTLGLHYGDLCGLGRKLADMLTCELTCLLLHRVQLSHDQCEKLVQRLSAIQNLTQLTLDKIKCKTHGGEEDKVRGECCEVKLENRLEMVTLLLLPFKIISFPAVDLRTCYIGLPDNVSAAKSALSSLTSAKNLREFQCGYVGDVATMQELMALLPKLTSLQKNYFFNIDFGRFSDIRLLAAATKTLEYVALYNSSITVERLEGLVQSVTAPRVKIKLRNVTISDSDPKDFFQRYLGRGVEYKERKGEWWVEELVFYTI